MIKTAHATWIQRVSWDIEKSVLDRKHSKHSKKDVYADDLSAEYKIKVRKEVEDKFRVHGEIRIPLAPFRIYGDRGRIRIEDEITLDGYYGVIHPKISCPGSSGDAH